MMDEGARKLVERARWNRTHILPRMHELAAEAGVSLSRPKSRHYMTFGPPSRVFTLIYKAVLRERRDIA